MSLLCVGSSVQNCHRHAKILDMSDERTDQSMRTLLFLLILVRCVLSTTHCADKLPRRGCKQIQIHTDSLWVIDFLRS